MAAKQTALPVGVCDHSKIEEVPAENGTVIGYRCRSCTFVLGGKGKCSGCRGDKILTVRVDKTGERFCTKDCKSNTLKERKRISDEKSSLAAKKEARR